MLFSRVPQLIIPADERIQRRGAKVEARLRGKRERSQLGLYVLERNRG
jgi:hypothetical protein